MILKGTTHGYAGRHREAIRLIRQGLSRIELFREPRLLVTARHNLILFMIEGGLHQEAEAALIEARSAFLAEDIGIDAALVSLDLALVYVQRGETAILQQLAAEMGPIFAAGDVHPEAAAAVVLFQQAAQAEQVTRALLETVAAEIQRTNVQAM